MNYFLNTHHFFPISCSHSKLQYIFFRQLSERYFIVKKKKLLWPLQCMEFYNLTKLNWQPITHWRNSYNVLRWLHTISHLFLHICCLVDGIVHFIWIQGWVNNYPHSVCGIYYYNLKKNISLHVLIVCQYTLSTCQQASSFRHKIQFIYLPIYFLLRAWPTSCPWLTSCLFWEYHCTRHLIFNCFDSCSLGVLMWSYIHEYVYGGARRRSWAQAPRRKYMEKNIIYTEFCDWKKKLIDRWTKCIGKQGEHVEKWCFFFKIDNNKFHRQSADNYWLTLVFI